MIGTSSVCASRPGMKQERQFGAQAQIAGKYHKRLFQTRAKLKAAWVGAYWNGLPKKERGIGSRVLRREKSPAQSPCAKWLIAFVQPSKRPFVCCFVPCLPRRRLCSLRGAVGGGLSFLSPFFLAFGLWLFSFSSSLFALVALVAAGGPGGVPCPLPSPLFPPVLLSSLPVPALCRVRLRPWSLLLSRPAWCPGFALRPVAPRAPMRLRWLRVPRAPLLCLCLRLAALLVPVSRVALRCFPWFPASRPRALRCPGGPVGLLRFPCVPGWLFVPARPRALRLLVSFSSVPPVPAALCLPRPLWLALVALSLLSLAVSLRPLRLFPVAPALGSPLPSLVALAGAGRLRRLSFLWAFRPWLVSGWRWACSLARAANPPYIHKGNMLLFCFFLTDRSQTGLKRPGRVGGLTLTFAPGRRPSYTP